jgi:hypothetical protein
MARQGLTQPSPWWVSRVVCAIGKKAGVKISTDAKGIVKYASAHDLRRIFGERWASRVVPQVLMELMRHDRYDDAVLRWAELSIDGRGAVGSLRENQKQSQCGQYSSSRRFWHYRDRIHAVI